MHGHMAQCMMQARSDNKAWHNAWAQNMRRMGSVAAWSLLLPAVTPDVSSSASLRCDNLAPGMGSLRSASCMGAAGARCERASADIPDNTRRRHQTRQGTRAWHNA